MMAVPVSFISPPHLGHLLGTFSVSISPDMTMAGSGGLSLSDQSTCSAKLILRHECQARAEIRLHIVTDWNGSASSEHSDEARQQTIEALDLSEQIHAALLGLSGDHFGNLEIQATLTNHNHEELIENVEVYNVTFVRSIEKKTVRVRVPMDAKLVSPGGQETEVVGPEIP